MLRFVRPAVQIRSKIEIVQKSDERENIKIDRKTAVPVKTRPPPIAVEKPEVPSVYRLEHEPTNSGSEDFDADGNLKPLPPPEILAEISERFSRAGYGAAYEFMDPKIWEKYRRPETGPERSMSAMEVARKKLLEEAYAPDKNVLEKQNFDFQKFFDMEVKRLTVFGRNFRLRGPAMQPLPKGYFNYQTEKVELLPEQSFLRLVGFDHLHLALLPKPEVEISAEIEKLQGVSEIEKEYSDRLSGVRERVEEQFSKVARSSARSELVAIFADEAYVEFIFDLQTKWAEKLDRPVKEIIEIQNLIIDSTHLSHLDVNWLFEKNWEISEMLSKITPEMMLMTFMSIKQETSITFGADFGAVLINCPELLGLNPKLINDRKKSFIGWDFDGENLGNIIRYSPDTFLNNHYDDIEAKIQYLVMRCNAPRDTIAEIGLLSLPVRDIAAKYEFLHRRGIIHRPSLKERRQEKKKHGWAVTEKNNKEKSEIMANIFMKTHEEFLDYAQCSQSEFNIWCKSWNAEIDALDGLATTNVHALMGMKIPFIMNKDLIKGSNYVTRQATTKNLRNSPVKQILWEIEEEEDSASVPDSPLYLELLEYGQENFHHSFQDQTETEIVEFDLEKKRWQKNYVKIDYETAIDLISNNKYLDIENYD